MVVAASTALTVAALSAAPSHASAQACTGSACTDVRPEGKGMIGLGVLGGEIGLIIPAIVQNAMHTNEWWPYLVFPLVGIGAGIGGGYALEQATGGWGSTSQNLASVDIGIMVGAFVLIIPTIVGTLALATYTPPAESATADDDMSYDDTTTDGDSVEAVHDGSSAAPDTSSSTTDSSTPPASSTSTGPTSQLIGGPGMVRMDADTHQIIIGVPMLGALGRYTSEELASLHMQQQYDMNIPLVSATF